MSWLPVLGGLLPLAAANALSTVPLMAAFAVLLGPRSRDTALPLLLGWLTGLLILTTVCVALPASVPTQSAQHERIVGAGAEILIGLALIAVGTSAWHRRSRQPHSGQVPHRRAQFKVSGPRSAVALGVGLNMRPKQVLLCLAAGIVIRNGDLSLSGTLLTALVFAALASASVTVPVLAILLNPDQVESRLALAQHWLSSHGTIIASVVSWMIGFVVLGDGLARL